MSNYWSNHWRTVAKKTEVLGEPVPINKPFEDLDVQIKSLETNKENTMAFTNKKERVEFVKKLIEDGENYAAISKMLNERGDRTKRGLEWRTNSITYFMLKNGVRLRRTRGRRRTSVYNGKPLATKTIVSDAANTARVAQGTKTGDWLTLMEDVISSNLSPDSKRMALRLFVQAETKM